MTSPTDGRHCTMRNDLYTSLKQAARRLAVKYAAANDVQIDLELIHLIPFAGAGRGQLRFDGCDMALRPKAFFFDYRAEGNDIVVRAPYLNACERVPFAPILAAKRAEIAARPPTQRDAVCAALWANWNGRRD